MRPRAPVRCAGVRSVGARAVVAAVLGAVLALGGCGSSLGAAGGADPRGRASSEDSGELRVFAAASLEPVLDDLTAAARTAHPELAFAPVTYAGSSTLAAQVVEGAHPDVLVTADDATMQTVVDAGLVVGDPTTVATNTLQVVVPAGNPQSVTSLADLAALSDGGGTVITCDVQVPCGAATARLLSAAGVSLTPASLEQSVTAVLAKVSAGEADAGVVYRTDVLRARGAVEGVDVPEASGVVTAYPAAVLSDAAPSAATFVDFLLSDEGQALLAARGFGPGH